MGLPPTRLRFCDICISSISRMRRSVSSPDEPPRRELKIWRAAEYFRRTSRCFIWWWYTVSNAWYYFSNIIIVEGQIKDAKMSSFSSDFETLIKHKFPLYFLYELLRSLRRFDTSFSGLSFSMMYVFCDMGGGGEVDTVLVRDLHLIISIHEFSLLLTLDSLDCQQALSLLPGLQSGEGKSGRNQSAPESFLTG